LTDKIDAQTVPKPYFGRYFQCLVEHLHLKKAAEFIPFVEELRNYG
jgi:hypothetical protein